MKRIITLLSILLLGACQLHAEAEPKTSASEALEKKDDGTFLKKHASFLERGKSGPIGVLFIGDSITERWRTAPDIWEKYYGKYQPANFGIGGDRTQNVIWQIEHGELDGLDPKVTVFMLGTNNSGDYTAEEIAAADRKIIGMIQTKLPHTKILVLGVFPRGPRAPKGEQITQANVDDAAKRMRVISAVNQDLAKLDNGSTIRYLDITHVFLDQDGHIPNNVMPEQLHPDPAGYQLWADAMQPLLESMLK